MKGNSSQQSLTKWVVEGTKVVASCFLAHRVPKLSEFVKGHLIQFSWGFTALKTQKKLW